ncbi:MAG TPA: RES domain-containing protein, partial [Burkholderiaceae bacterium]
MLTVYRIVKARNVRGALSGEGARLAGGRWHRPGEAIVYASASLALAALETLVHVGEDAVHIRFAYLRIQIADSVAVESCRPPPRHWRAEPPQSGSMRYGSAWLRGARTAVLEVPSAIVPLEKNYLLNPGHP